MVKIKKYIDIELLSTKKFYLMLLSYNSDMFNKVNCYNNSYIYIYITVKF